MIIRMRLRAGAAIPGRLSTHPLCPRSPGTGPSEQSTTQQQRRTRLPPSAPTTKSPAQDGISIESHPRSSTEPRKYKRLRRRPRRARRFLADVARRQPGLFAHWRFGVRPDGWTMGAR